VTKSLEKVGHVTRALQCTYDQHPSESKKKHSVGPLVGIEERPLGRRTPHSSPSRQELRV